MPATCPYEHFVVEAVTRGRWTHGCDPHLVDHAAGCEICRDVAEIATTLRMEAAAREADIGLPTAGQVWWSAAVRARMHAAQAAARPLTWAHGVAGASLAGVFAAAAALGWPALRQGGERLIESATTTLEPAWLDAAAPLLATLWRTAPALLGVVACVLLLQLLVLCVALSWERR